MITFADALSSPGAGFLECNPASEAGKIGGAPHVALLPQSGFMDTPSVCRMRNETEAKSLAGADAGIPKFPLPEKNLEAKKPRDYH